MDYYCPQLGRSLPLPRIILASSSPRRKQLLEEAGIPCVVVPPELDEFDSSSHPDLSGIELAALNARSKCDEVASKYPHEITLAADTLVLCEDEVLGKPKDIHHASAMLRALSGRTHSVVTACCLKKEASNLIYEAAIVTRVTFRVLNDSTIQEYISKVNVMDKAGAYALQEHGNMIVEKIEGSRSNVVGLPVDTIIAWLEKISIAP